METLLNIPIPIRLGFLFVVGTVIAGQLNRGIYRLAWNRRNIGPWSPAPNGVQARGWLDRIPIFGWWSLRRESNLHSTRYWVRPALIELFTGIGFAALYWLEVQRHILWPSDLAAVPDGLTLHAQFLNHAVLISLMIMATFIDLDEQTIPDEITLFGTVAGVLVAAIFPFSFLPTIFEPAYGTPSVHTLVYTSSNFVDGWRTGIGGPASWPTAMDGWGGLGLALSLAWAWCLAILHKTWTTRYGLIKAVRFAIVSVIRHNTWIAPAALGLLLSLVVMTVWGMGGSHWESTLSAIVGIGAGGALIWGIRIVGGRALNMEAMGFGDVTLMAMIGAFLGWQATFLVLFMAPFSALIIAVAQWLLSGNRHIAFGPYLCLSTVILLVAWNSLWTNWACLMFSFGWFIPGMFVCCLILMGGLLSLWRVIRDAIF